MHSPRRKSFETGTVPVARDSHPLSSVLFKIVHTDYPIKIQHFHMLGTKYTYPIITITMTPV